jgi:hypothetical protein
MSNLQLHVHVVEACNIPRTDFLTASDLYMTLQVSTSAAIQSTQIIEKTQSPIWNQQFHFAISGNYQNNSYLTCIVKNHSGQGFDNEVVRAAIPLTDLPPFEISDNWYILESRIGDRNDRTEIPQVRIVRQIAPAGHPAFTQPQRTPQWGFPAVDPHLNLGGNQFLRRI